MSPAKTWGALAGVAVATVVGLVTTRDTPPSPEPESQPQQVVARRSAIRSAPETASVAVEPSRSPEPQREPRALAATTPAPLAAIMPTAKRGTAPRRLTANALAATRSAQKLCTASAIIDGPITPYTGISALFGGVLYPATITDPSKAQITATWSAIPCHADSSTVKLGKTRTASLEWTVR